MKFGARCTITARSTTRNCSAPTSGPCGKVE
jgi:hypothetical protein